MLSEFVGLVSYAGYMYAIRRDGTLFRISIDRNGSYIFVRLGEIPTN